MANTATEQTLIIHREKLTPGDGLPGDELTDAQIQLLELFQLTIANTALVSFTAVPDDHLPIPREKAIYEANVARFQRVVREHIAARITADNARLLALAAAIPLPADPVRSRLANEYDGKRVGASTGGLDVVPGVNAAPLPADATRSRLANEYDGERMGVSTGGGSDIAPGVNAAPVQPSRVAATLAAVPVSLAVSAQSSAVETDDVLPGA